MYSNKNILKIMLILVALVALPDLHAQQDPQYTHYMYNTMSINPAYAGQRDVLSFTGLYRTQWVGIDGAPESGSLGIHSPVNNGRLGIGLNIVRDALGPANETFVDANLSYSIPVNEQGLEFSFGSKLGAHQLKTDWTRGRFRIQTDPTFNQNISVISPVIGAGLYLHSDKWYLGASIPNFITTEHYDDVQESIASERINFYFIGGYVFNINRALKLKPSFFVKAVSGAPVIADLSANFLYQNKLNLGLAYRWDDSISALLGFQITDGMYLGYSYDLTTTGLSNYNSGTHEILLRFELPRVGRLISPRFF